MEPVKLHGVNPRTGLPVIIVFNEPTPARSSILMWNHLMKKWLVSLDAGLRWEQCDYHKTIHSVDCIYGHLSMENSNRRHK